MRTVKINGTNYNVLEVTKTIEGVPVTCTIILDDTVDDFDVVASYQGEFDLDVITEIINKRVYNMDKNVFEDVAQMYCEYISDVYDSGMEDAPDELYTKMLSNIQDIESKYSSEKARLDAIKIYATNSMFEKKGTSAKSKYRY